MPSGGIAADAMEEGVTGFDVQLYRGDTCAVLPPVMLLFHEQVQLVEAVQYGAVLLQVIGERLA